VMVEVDDGVLEGVCVTVLEGVLVEVAEGVTVAVFEGVTVTDGVVVLEGVTLGVADVEAAVIVTTVVFVLVCAHTDAVDVTVKVVPQVELTPANVTLRNGFVEKLPGVTLHGITTA